eukprot:scaffold4544_cov86-Skeletonema_dohrnii-CCMP3373.AAC.1
MSSAANMSMHSYATTRVGDLMTPNLEMAASSTLDDNSYHEHTLLSNAAALHALVRSNEAGCLQPAAHLATIL